jgi:hypothetical protein
VLRSLAKENNPADGRQRLFSPRYSPPPCVRYYLRRCPGASKPNSPLAGAIRNCPLRDPRRSPGSYPSAHHCPPSLRFFLCPHMSLIILEFIAAAVYKYKSKLTLDSSHKQTV